MHLLCTGVDTLVDGMQLDWMILKTSNNSQDFFLRNFNFRFQGPFFFFFFYQRLPILGITMPFASIKTFKKIFWIPSFWSLCGKRPTGISLPVPFCENSSVARDLWGSALITLLPGHMATPASQFWPTRVSTST